MEFQFRINYKNKSDEELIVLINKGKEKAFNEIYERYSKKLFLFFYQKLYRDNNKAQDFLQDLFLKLVEKAELFDYKKSFSSWIYCIAYNMCKNEYRNNATRKGKTINLNVEELKNDAASSIIINNEDDFLLFKKSLNNELGKLNEKHSVTFILRHQDNMSIKEISEIMACSEGTVKSRLFYATKKLSVKLKKFSSIKI
ncbi:RNA polymerase sigma factor [Flavivirga abyssicola]|uniref:RNA polymerase sigma factor n=1 Tax=Flavivirga abyssicola TaxID=3063533 RepID=UPI0026DF9BD7|nr:RNA polymerase sigma factor [Flavivirga sp. MEBiC07777]WVK15025.1 RNA polymerase sigma factor [Flavivirga sp. MEBiC07777]